MKKLFILFFCLIFLTITAQENTNYFTKINFENHIIVDNDKYLCLLSYSLPYNQLVFVKENNRFLSGFSLSLEIFDESGFIKREYGTSKLSVDEFDLTNSSVLKIDGFTKITFDQKKYTIKPFLSLDNTNITVPCTPFEIDLKNKLDSVLYSPIAVSKKNGGLYLLNENNSVKFEDENSSLLFLLYNKPSKIELKIRQDDKLVYSEELKSHLKGGIKYKEENNSILLQVDTSFSNYNIFLLSNLNRFLDDGDFNTDIIIDGKVNSYKLKSEWISKPKSLAYPEIVISALGIIFPQDTVSKLSRVKDEDFYPKVKAIFSNKFPSKTKFNKQFNEFFQRVDYTEMNFRSLKSKLGVESDRGIVYIKYGKPDFIDREYKARDDVSEIWTYKSLSKTFIFTDKTGTGDYILVK